MLSIAKIAGASYYLDLAREDYYVNGGEPPGKWHGSFAKALGLNGNVQQAELRSLFDGYHPQTGAALVQQQNWKDRIRTPAWDLTFSAPKSVSVLWAAADRDTRQAIQVAQEEAVKVALQYVQEQAGFCRAGKGGEELRKCDVAFALFEHGTSRAQDPQLHTHVLVPNIGLCQDGRTRALHSKPLYEHKMTAGALYRAELAFQLTAVIGLALVRDEQFFRASLVSRDIEEHFSTRRLQITEQLAAVGYSSAKAAEIANKDTRQEKQYVARENLFSEWSEAIHDLGLTREQITSSLGTPRVHSSKDESRLALSACKRGLERLEDATSMFTRKDLIRFAAEEAQATNVPVNRIISAVETTLADCNQTIRLKGQSIGEPLFTTPAAVKRERDIDLLAERSKENHYHILAAEAVTRATETVERELRAKHFDVTIKLSNEQVQAVRHVTERSGSIQCVEGHAGSGKTTLLRAARLAWENEGYTVFGGTLSARAAKQLENESGIKSDTLSMLSLRLASPTLREKVTHHAKELAKEALRASPLHLDLPPRQLPNKSPESIRLNEKSVLVIDEAGMVGSKVLEFFLRQAEASGTKVVLVGDTEQLQPIGPGSAFYQVKEKVGAAELKDNRRQYELWEREALSDVRNGNATQALTNYIAAERLHITEDRITTSSSLIAKWNQERTPDLASTLILAGTNEEVSELNRLAQEKRLVAGELSNSPPIQFGNVRLFENDRVLFLRNDRALGLNNGDRGTVRSIRSNRHGTTVTVAVDGPNRSRYVTFSQSDYRDVALGYAMTTHKAQGATCDRAFVLGNPSMQNKYLSYVQLSRAREKTHIFVTKEQAGSDLTALANAMQKEREAQLIREREKQQEQVLGSTLEIT